MPELDLHAVREMRARHPERIAELAATRRRRPLLGPTGKLLVLAADHPARGSLSAGSRPDAMADRHDLLARLLVALARPGVDGILATPDIVEELLMLGALDDRIVIGSMNRGGLLRTSFELDDRFTAFDAPALAAAGYDGGKMLCRIDPSDLASVRTMESCAEAVGQLAARGLMAMVEPFWCRRVDGMIRNELDADSVIRSIHVAQGMGVTSAHTWLKLPVVDDMERVMRATTLPTLLLGGDPADNSEHTYAAWANALAVDGVRGLVVGRSLLYPPDDDVAAAVDIAAALVNGDYS